MSFYDGKDPKEDPWASVFSSSTPGSSVPAYSFGEQIITPQSSFQAPERSFKAPEPRFDAPQTFLEQPYPAQPSFNDQQPPNIASEREFQPLAFESQAVEQIDQAPEPSFDAPQTFLEQPLSPQPSFNDQQSTNIALKQEFQPLAFESRAVEQTDQAPERILPTSQASLEKALSSERSFQAPQPINPPEILISTSETSYNEEQLIAKKLSLCFFFVGVFIFVNAIFTISNRFEQEQTSQVVSQPDFTHGGALDSSVNICAGRFIYTATANGSLKSPNYGFGNYPPNSDCTNRIESGTFGITFEINAFNTEKNFDKVVFSRPDRDYTFDGNHMDVNGPQVGDRFSFNGPYVDVKFTSDSTTEAPGFSFAVVDGYESANDISNLAYAQKRINPKELRKD